jgi:hypothetical protein
MRVARAPALKRVRALNSLERIPAGRRQINTPTRFSDPGVFVREITVRLGRHGTWCRQLIAASRGEP